MEAAVSDASEQSVFHVKHTKPWRALFSKQELPLRHVMFTVKASDGQELSVPVRLGEDDDVIRVLTVLNDLTAACAAYEATLAPAEEQK